MKLQISSTSSGPWLPDCCKFTSGALDKQRNHKFSSHIHCLSCSNVCTGNTFAFVVANQPIQDCSLQGSIPEAHLDKFTGHDYLPGISGDQGSEIFLSCCGLSFRGLEDEIEKNQRDPSRAWK